MYENVRDAQQHTCFPLGTLSGTRSGIMELIQRHDQNASSVISSYSETVILLILHETFKGTHSTLRFRLNAFTIIERKNQTKFDIHPQSSPLYARKKSE